METGHIQHCSSCPPLFIPFCKTPTVPRGPWDAGPEEEGERALGMCQVLFAIMVSFIQLHSKYWSSVNSMLELGWILPDQQLTEWHRLCVMDFTFYRGKQTKPTKKTGNTNYNTCYGRTIIYLPLWSYEITQIIPVVWTANWGSEGWSELSKMTLRMGGDRGPRLRSIWLQISTPLHILMELLLIGIRSCRYCH